MRDFQHFFGRDRFVSIVPPPKERKILVHLMPPVCRSLDIDYLGALELGANDRSAGLFDCPSKLETAASKGSGLRDGPVRQSCLLYPRTQTSLSAIAMSTLCITRHQPPHSINLVGVGELWYADAFSDPKEPSFCGSPRNNSRHPLERTSDSLCHSHT